MTYIAAHALGIALLLLLFQATGQLVVRAARALDGVERTGLVPMALGMCAWMYWLFALACVGLLRYWMIVASAIVVGVARALPASRRSRAIASDSTDRRGPWTLAIQAVAWLPPALVLAVLFVQTLGPWLGWDDMTAHLTLPKIYLEHGGFLRLPFNVY